MTTRPYPHSRPRQRAPPSASELPRRRRRRSATPRAAQSPRCRASCSASRPSSASGSTTSTRSRTRRSRRSRSPAITAARSSSLSYDAPVEGVGTAQITLRIPTAEVEAALAELSQLGTILGQRYGIQDLQQQADSLQTQIEQTQRRIAQILAQLGSPTLSDENRVVLKSRLASNRQKLTDLRAAMKSTRAEAATSTVYVTLTTEEIQATPVGGGSRLDDVKDVLAWEAIAALYVLVVVGPFVLLGLAVWLCSALLRRRETARLLEQN